MLNQGQSSSGPNQINAWQNHIAGATKMVQLRGRDKHRSGYGLDLYDSVRITAVIQGIARRAPNAFLELPWAPPQNTLADQLWSMGAMLPKLLQDSDLLCARLQGLPELDEHAVAQILDLTSRFQSLGGRLCDWELRALTLCQRTPRTTEEELSLLSDGPVQLRNVCTLYGNGFFFACAQYWTISMKTYTAAHLFHRRFGAIGGPDIPPLPSVDESRATRSRHCAHCIAFLQT